MDILLFLLWPRVARMKSSSLCIMFLQHFSQEELRVPKTYNAHNTPWQKKNVFVVFLPGPKSEEERILKIKSNSDIKEKA